MDFGLFFLMQRDPTWSEEQVYEAEVAQMVAAEDFGFHSVWIAEHHFSDYGVCPAPPVLAAHVAARTRRLRIGMGVSLLPLHDPLALAEQLAVLDVVSGGRLEVGIGRGGAERDHRIFGGTPAEGRDRIAEGIELMRRCWSGEPFSFTGVSAAWRRCASRPRQRPHLPLYLAANSADTSVFAARLGLPTLSSFFVPLPELRRRQDAFRDEAPATGLSGAGGRAAGPVLGDARRPRRDRRRGRVDAARGPFMAYQALLANRHAGDTAGPAPATFDRSLLRLRPFEEYLDQRMAIFGGPDEVVDGLGRYAEATGYRRIMLLIALIGMPPAAALRAMEVFAAKVAPQLRSQFAGQPVS
ncbi:MAG: LLM class flavin-dependent oxidoreductase [Dehalococcoidia bacterium]